MGQDGIMMVSKRPTAHTAVMLGSLDSRPASGLGARSPTNAGSMAAAITSLPRCWSARQPRGPCAGPKAGGRAAPPNSKAACSTLHLPLCASGERPAAATTPTSSHTWRSAPETSESQSFPEESGLEGGVPPIAELQTTADDRLHRDPSWGQRPSHRTAD
nr:uncharacterized protein LOC105730940 [Aotus nancymaae]